MRWIALPLIVALGGCWALQPSGGTGAGTATDTTGTSGDDAGSSCTSTSNCSDCVACALNSPCATLFATCEQSSDCQGIDQCFGLCGADSACKAQCYANDPAGASDYQAVNQCVYCQQCASQCAGQCM